jgi:hypothetical protein
MLSRSRWTQTTGLYSVMVKGEPMWFTATGFEIPTETKKLDQTKIRLWK